MFYKVNGSIINHIEIRENGIEKALMVTCER